MVDFRPAVPPRPTPVLIGGTPVFIGAVPPSHRKHGFRSYMRTHALARPPTTTSFIHIRVGRWDVSYEKTRPTYQNTGGTGWDGLPTKGKTMSKNSLRSEMPVVAALIDKFRAAFGNAHIDGVIKAGMKGQPVFFAAENGHTVGTPIPPGASGPDLNTPALLARETHRERYYREASARSKALTTRLNGQ